jgi:hypothetical protein
MIIRMRLRAARRRGHPWPLEQALAVPTNRYARLGRVGRGVHNPAAEAYTTSTRRSYGQKPCSARNPGRESPTIIHGAPEILARADLIEFDRPLRFRHPLLHAAVDAGITAFERDSGHRSAVTLLRARNAAPERVAAQILAAAPNGNPDDAETLRRAAIRAIERGAPAGAVALLRRTLEEPLATNVRIQVLFDLGDVEVAVGQPAVAAEHLREALHLAAEDPILRARALVALARTVGPNPERKRELVPLLDAALADLPASERDRELRLRLQAAALTTAFYSGAEDDPRRKTIADELSQLAGDTTGESIALSALLEPLVTVADASLLGSLAERAARNAAELLTAGLQDGRAHFLLIALRWSDRLDAAARLTSEWLAIARRQGSQEAFAAASLHSSNLNRTRGRLRERKLTPRRRSPPPLPEISPS